MYTKSTREALEVNSILLDKVIAQRQHDREIKDSFIFLYHKTRNYADTGRRKMSPYTTDTETGY